MSSPSPSSSSSPRSPFRSDLLSSHVALITGGGSGIGFEIARQLGLHGCSVVIMGRRSDVLSTSVQQLEKEGIRGFSISGDVRSIEDCRRAVEYVISQCGQLDVVVNCAAGNFLCPAEDLSSKAFSTVIEIDTIGTFNMSNAAFPHIRKSSHPSIINISATLHLYATHWQAHASAAKAAIDSLTRSLSLEWGAYGIRVNGIAPGNIKGTPGGDKLGFAWKEEDVVRVIPLGRMGEKWDIAMMAVMLVGDGGRWVSGQTIVVDGGALNWRPEWATKEQVRAFGRQVEKNSRKEGAAPVEVKAKL